VAEYVYEIDAGAGAPAGLSELLALDGSRYLALERSVKPVALGQGRSVKLFLVDLAGASNVLDRPALAGDYRPVTKTLLLDLASSGVTLDNIEGMTFGETLETGNRSLILVSDNNFSKSQVTQFLAFEVMPEPAQERIILASSQPPSGGRAPIR
jgi:hypothetical protein